MIGSKFYLPGNTWRKIGIDLALNMVSETAAEIKTRRATLVQP
jgi:hypothetical protein